MGGWVGGGGTCSSLNSKIYSRAQGRRVSLNRGGPKHRSKDIIVLAIGTREKVRVTLGDPTT